MKIENTLIDLFKNMLVTCHREHTTGIKNDIIFIINNYKLFLVKYKLKYKNSRLTAALSRVLDELEAQTVGVWRLYCTLNSIQPVIFFKFTRCHVHQNPNWAHSILPLSKQTTYKRSMHGKRSLNQPASSRFTIVWLSKK